MFMLAEKGGAQMVAGLDARAAHMAEMPVLLERASDYIYRQTAHRFDSEGEGDWPPLAESTVAKKISQGYGDPARPLYAEGNLYESATSPYGPYSQRIQTGGPGHESIIMLVDWENDGWQIPSVLSAGDEHIPARPIWPPAERMEQPVQEILMAGL